MRAALYARYSSDRQNERSIDDQIAVCRQHADRRGWSVVATFSDAAISGAAMANRPGLLGLIASAEAGAFDLVLVEDQDRLARNLEHEAHVFNRLKRAGVTIATLATDQVKILDVAFKGLMNELYLSALGDKTRRGMHANAERGLATGSRIYGYRSQPGGQQVILDDEAAVIVEIFDRYAAGETTRGIVSDLNARKVPGPAGGPWGASTLNGSVQRGNGILNRELYIGVKVWNRIDMRKDTLTGKRTSTPRPPEEWKRIPVPALRIVTQAAWQAVRARKSQEAKVPFQRLRQRRSGVFSGLIKCGQCGATMTSYDGRRRLICAAHREKGNAVCANSRTVSRAEVEGRVLTAMRTRLLSPQAVRAYVKAFHEAWSEKQARATSTIAPLTKRLAELDRAIPRLVDKICDGADTPTTNQRLRELESEKVQVTDALTAAQAAAPPPVTLHPGLADRYADRLQQLQDLLASSAALEGATAEELVASARDLIVKIVITPTGKGQENPVRIQLHGALANFLPAAAETAAGESLSRVVAGGGLEPPTCGL